MQIVAKIVAVVVVDAVVAAVGEVGIGVVAVVVALEPCVEADGQFLKEFGKIGFAVVVDEETAPDVSGSVRLAAKIPLAVGWVRCDPVVVAAAAVAFAGCCVAEAVVDGRSALAVAVEEVPA